MKKIMQETQRYCELSCFLLLVSCILSFCGCGYSTHSLLPSYLQKVHIKIFTNQTVKAGLDELATNAVTEAFRDGSSLRIVDENSADLVIEGTISGYAKDPYIYTADQTVIENKITIKLTVRCLDKARNQIFWEGDVSDWVTYTTEEEAGISAAMKKTADRLVTTILTNW